MVYSCSWPAYQEEKGMLVNERVHPAFLKPKTEQYSNTRIL